MKKVKSLYFIAALFFIIIIISLFISVNEDFDLTIGNKVLYGSFDRSCDNCDYNTEKRILECNCRRNNKTINTKAQLKLSESQDKTLGSNYIIVNNDGNLSLENK